MTLFRFIVWFCLGSLLLRCQPIDRSPATYGYDYFPLETGHYVIYNVTEQRYVLGASPNAKTYQLKERIGNAFPNVAGQLAYPVLRYRRSTDNQPWQLDSISTIRRLENEAIRTENGQDFIKLVFPIKNETVWNGNQRNNLDADTYTMRNAGQAYYVLGNNFAETVTVVAQDDSTLTFQAKRIEVYARQIGMIYKELTNVQYCTATPTCIGRSQIDYGTRYIYRIQAYGKE